MLFDLFFLKIHLSRPLNLASSGSLLLHLAPLTNHQKKIYSRNPISLSQYRANSALPPRTTSPPNGRSYVPNSTIDRFPLSVWELTKIRTRPHPRSATFAGNFDQSSRSSTLSPLQRTHLSLQSTTHNDGWDLQREAGGISCY